MKYDDASWHYGGDFPADLPQAAGATHIGMFLAWLIRNDYASQELIEEAEEEIELLKSEKLSGAQFLMRVLDEKFTDQELNEEGNAFAVAYYLGEDHDSRFVDDYFEEFGVDEQTMYGVSDDWEQFHRIAPKINARYQAWVAAGRPEYVI